MQLSTDGNGIQEHEHIQTGHLESFGSALAVKLPRGWQGSIMTTAPAGFEKPVPRRVLLASFVSIAWLWPLRARADGLEIVVIVHKDNPINSMDADDLKPLFRTKARRWKNGDRVFPLNLKRRSQPRVEFDKAVLGFTSEESDDYWIDRKIRGGAPPPKTLRSPAAVVAAVSRHRGAIGYVPVRHRTADVKVVARVIDGAVVPGRGGSK